MRCRPIDDPGIDCGGSVEDGPLDAGYLRGTGNTVTFVHDPELISKLTGCKLPVSETLPDHCGPGGGGPLTWEIEGDSLTLSGDVMEWSSSSIARTVDEDRLARNHRCHRRAGSGWAIHPEPAVQCCQPVGQSLQTRAGRVRAASPVVGDDSLDGTVDPSHRDADPLRVRVFDCVGQRFRADVEERRLCVLVAGRVSGNGHRHRNRAALGQCLQGLLKPPAPEMRRRYSCDEFDDLCLGSGQFTDNDVE